MSINKRNESGAVNIEVYRDRLRLRLPRELFSGKQKAIYTRLPDTRDGWREAQKLAWQIEDDIKQGLFDATLLKYKPSIRVVTEDVVTLTNLLELWDRYCEYRRPQVSITHFQENYQKRYRNAILELPSTALADAIAIRDYLLKHKSAGTAKQMLIQFNAACKFAVRSRLLTENPFAGMASDIKSKPRHHADIDPFTAAERDAIIAAFEQHPHYCHYAPFVKFLFLTGCRTSEAIGLRWGDINVDLSQITFSSAIAKKVRKPTKTNRSRKFPTSAQLQNLLRSLRSDSVTAEELVFKNSIGNQINPSTFIHNAWSGDRSKKVGIVTKLVDEGKVERYRPQYNTRHTFITMCLEEGISIPQIARWVGNSPGTLLAHYGGVIKLQKPPDF